MSTVPTASRLARRVPAGSSNSRMLGQKPCSAVALILPMHLLQPASVSAATHSSSGSSSGPDAAPRTVPAHARMEHKYETPASPKVEKVFDKILDLDMFEVHLVTQLLAKKLGMNVNAAAMSGGGAGGGTKAGGAKEEVAAVEEKTAFDLKLVSFDAKAKIKVIKEVLSIAGLGLKEAKELVEGAPKTVMKEIKKEKAEKIKAKLEGLGAVVEIS